MVVMPLIPLFALAAVDLDVGPVLGDLTEHSVTVFAQAMDPEELELRVLGGDGSVEFSARAAPDPEADGRLRWDVVGLEPSTRYQYMILSVDDPDQALAAASFVTAPTVEALVPITLAFASCAREDSVSEAVWRRMRTRAVDALVLLGDTPYIDTTDLERQRARYREFAVVPEFAALVRQTPLYCTWDDHDFGANDTDGRLPGKENSRRAFLEYRPNPSAGEGGEGIYTSFRRGAIEVFLLDARWFAATQPSPFDASRPTLLGERQWAWLRRRLGTSTAPFKVISTGMIFNDAVRPGKTDYWGHYPHEREALFRLIGELELSGVVLVGGDVHRHRIVRHDATRLAGYDLVEFISSPVHGQVIESANAPHPGLILDIGRGGLYLELEADPSGSEPVLVSRFVHADGPMLDERRWPLSTLRRR